MGADHDSPPTWDQTVSRAISDQLRHMPVVSHSVGHAAAVVIEDVQARRDARLTEFFGTVQNQVGDNEAIRDRLVSNPEVESVFVSGLNAALFTGLEAKRRLLAQVVSAAILDDARVDESALIAQALRDLEAPHFRALERIRRQQDTPPPDRSGEPPPEGWPSNHQSVIDLVKQENDAVMAALLRTGTLTQVVGELILGIGGEVVVTGLSDFGRALLDDIRAHDVDQQL